MHTYIHTNTHTHTCTHTYIHTHTHTHTHRAKNSIKHFPIRWNGREFGFSFDKYLIVEDFIDHSESKPVVGGESGTSGVRLVMSMYSKLAQICPL